MKLTVDGTSYTLNFDHRARTAKHRERTIVRIYTRDGSTHMTAPPSDDGLLIACGCCTRDSRETPNRKLACEIAIGKAIRDKQLRRKFLKAWKARRQKNLERMRLTDGISEISRYLTLNIVLMDDDPQTAMMEARKMCGRLLVGKWAQERVKKDTAVPAKA
jgi:hypothetical protein